MFLKFIGTSSGQTHPKRYHSSLLFNLDSTIILIDAGDGISKALMKQDINHNKIDKIIISHFHADHLAGLPSLLTQMIITKRSKPLDIYIPRKMMNMLEHFLQISFLFIDKYDFEIRLNEYELNNKIDINKNFQFIARQNNHIINKHNFNNKYLEFISVSFLFIIVNKNIVYTSDVGNAKDLNLFNDFTTDLLITETTHISLTDIINFNATKNLSKVILTHINYDDEENIKNWYKNLNKDLTQKIKLAFDGMVIKL